VTPVPIVDSHCHASLAWFQPVESLVHEMDAAGVQHAVLIQIRGQHDNTYQEACRRRFPGRFATVVYIDWEQPDAATTLRRLVQEGASGLRLRPFSRSLGDDPLAIWRAAADLGIAVSCLGTAAEFTAPAFTALVEALPGLRIVLEHLAGIGSPEPTSDPAHHRAVLDLARYPNLYVKLPGLGEFCERAVPVREPFPFVEPVPPLLERFVDAYGPGRLMWGSDFPPVAGREGYGNALRLPMARLEALPAAAREAVFGGTALAAFPLRD
jgi:L-fuconolactonase